jgi:branched-chain amino acid transport system permease protein
VHGVSLGIVLVVCAIVSLLLPSKHGLARTAIRDSEPASARLGVDTYRIKLLIDMGTAACTGRVGAFIGLQKLRLSLEAGFSLNDWTVVVVCMVVIGGLGTLAGPIIDLLLYFALRELLAQYGTWYLILLGAVAVVIMLRAREGIWGLIAQRCNLPLFSVRRYLAREMTAMGGEQGCHRQ